MKIARCVWLSVCSVASARLLGQTTISADQGEEPVLCGSVPSYKNAKPKNYEDARPTKYDSETKKTVPITFKAGDTIPFKCEKGYTTDGAKDGETTFDVTCKDSGFYEPAKTCIKASPCGELPTIKNAAPTGKVDKGNVQFKCNHGYSLDGEKVVAGGFAKNAIFVLECDAFAGAYKDFEGKCKPYGFVPAGEMVKGYNMVFEALFCASCEGTLRRKFPGTGKPPEGLDKVCEKVDGGGCSGLVSAIKADFEKQAKAYEEHKKGDKKDWFETDDGAPGIKDEAKKFCEGVWKAIQMPDR